MKKNYRKVHLISEEKWLEKKIKGIGQSLGVLALMASTPLLVNHYLVQQEGTDVEDNVLDHFTALHDKEMYESGVSHVGEKGDIRRDGLCEVCPSVQQGNRGCGENPLFCFEKVKKVIQEYKSPDDFYTDFKPLYTCQEVLDHLKVLPDENRKQVKSLFSFGAQDDEGTLAHDVEWSNLGLESQEQRMRQSVPVAKAGFFVHFFRKIFTYIYGKDVVQDAIESAQRSRQKYQHLRHKGLLDEDIMALETGPCSTKNVMSSIPFPGELIQPSCSPKQL